MKVLAVCILLLSSFASAQITWQSQPQSPDYSFTQSCPGCFQSYIQTTPYVITPFSPESSYYHLPHSQDDKPYWERSVSIEGLCSRDINMLVTTPKERIVLVVPCKHFEYQKVKIFKSKP